MANIQHCPIADEDEMFALVTTDGDLRRVYPIAWNQRECEAVSCDILLVGRDGMAARDFPKFMDNLDA